MEEYVKVRNFESRMVYRSTKKPGYAAWVSFFPGKEGKWYLSFMEMEQKDYVVKEFPRDFYYQMSLPTGMDDARMLHDIVILESDDLKTWKEISHDTSHHRESFGNFAQAYVGDGIFLRFVWQGYSYEPGRHPGEIYYISGDYGKSWNKQPPFHDRRFISYPHRLRTLRDGTLVLALPLALDFNMERIRSCNELNAENETTMTLCFSHDRGKTWTSPLPIYGGHPVTETDFVELPSGDLLFINCSFKHFGHPGRQVIYRTEKGFIPGPYERALKWETCVPETVALTEDGILVGCMRSPAYAWSDDLGLTWYDLKGFPDEITHPRKYGRCGEVYQPWNHYLGDGRFACAGHYGYDDVFNKEYDNYIMMHFFELQIAGIPKSTRLVLERDYDEETKCWPNRYTMTLTCDGEPLADKEIELWWVKWGEPGGETENVDKPLEERIKMGGELIRIKTGKDGKARVSLQEPDVAKKRHWTEDIGDYIYLCARFNADRSDQDYKPAQTPQFGFYTRFCYTPGMERCE